MVMELYEIVKFTHKPTKGEDYFEPEVITATMDKDLAEKMLTIYKSNQKMHESYQIRTVREPKTVSFFDPTHCEFCNSYCRCVDTIETRPDAMIRCIRFGELRRHIKNEEN
jgi:hypothetical protein